MRPTPKEFDPRPERPVNGNYPVREHLALIDEKPGTLKSLAARDQIPIRQPHGSADLEGEIRGWSRMASYAGLVAVELFRHCGLSRDIAAELASYTMRARNRWREISTGSKNIFLAGIDLPDELSRQPEPVLPHPMPDFVVHVARGSHSYTHKDLIKHAVGTLNEIAEEHADANHITAISLTDCAALMKQRAAVNGVDLGAFFDGGDDV